MIKNKMSLVAALIFPVIILGALVAYKQFIFSEGQEIVLPIKGYDPRDLLSGHYLIYRVQYGVEGICANSNQGEQEAFVCLETNTFSFEKPSECRELIQGACISGEFQAGIERFYVPEEKARQLESKIMEKSASISISILPSGKAQVKDLFFDGKSWRDY